MFHTVPRNKLEYLAVYGPASMGSSHNKKFVPPKKVGQSSPKFFRGCYPKTSHHAKFHRDRQTSLEIGGCQLGLGQKIFLSRTDRNVTTWVAPRNVREARLITTPPYYRLLCTFYPQNRSWLPRYMCLFHLLKLFSARCCASPIGSCMRSSCLLCMFEIHKWLLSKRVLTTLSLYATGWCELKFKYWSVWVVFLYICNVTSFFSDLDYQYIQKQELTFRFHFICELDVTRLIHFIHSLIHQGRRLAVIRRAFEPTASAEA